MELEGQSDIAGIDDFGFHVCFRLRANNRVIGFIGSVMSTVDTLGCQNSVESRFDPHSCASIV